jgi:lipopolysaccharide export system permease protein
MLAILLAFMRMAADNEIMALKSAGVSLYRMMPPALVIIFIGAAATLSMTVYGMPQSKLAVKRLTYETLAAHANVGLKARTFNNQFKQVTLYVNAIDTSNLRLTDVFIEDRRNPDAVSTIVAPSGELIRVPDRRAVRVRLYDGLINQVKHANKSASTLYFATYDIEFGMKQAAKLSRYKRKDEDEMSLAELDAHINSVKGDPEDYREALNEYHMKFSIPAACLALGLLAIPLGVELKSSRKSAGLGMGLLVFLLYYVMMTGGITFGEMGLIAPVIGLWVPNVVFSAAGMVMLVRSANEKPLYWMDALRLAGALMARGVKNLSRRLRGR